MEAHAWGHEGGKRWGCSLHLALASYMHLRRLAGTNHCSGEHEVGGVGYGASRHDGPLNMQVGVGVLGIKGDLE